MQDPATYISQIPFLMFAQTVTDMVVGAPGNSSAPNSQLPATLTSLKTTHIRPWSHTHARPGHFEFIIGVPAI